MCDNYSLSVTSLTD